MKKGILLGVVILTGGFGWCEESAIVDEKAPLSTTSDAASVTGKKGSVVASEAQVLPADSNKSDQAAVPAPVAVEAKKDSSTPAKIEPASSVAKTDPGPVGVEANKETMKESSTPAKAEPAPAVAKTDPAPIAQKPAEDKPAGRVALLQKISVFHEKEIATVDEMIARWNITLKPILARQLSLKEDLTNKRAQLQSLDKETTKAARKEAKMLKKEISGTEKLIQSIQKDITGQYKSMANEIKVKAGITESTFQGNVRSILEELQSPLK